jgi:hypothetical protein
MPVNLFTTNIPLKGQSLGFTQPLVLGNFGNYKENMEVNHELINGADFGKHKFLTLTNQAAAPTTGATESGMYGKAVAGRMVNFFQRESNLAEVGMVIYPGRSPLVGTSNFASPVNIIDLSTLADATHPNYWAMFEMRSEDGLTMNFMALIKWYKGTSGNEGGASVLAVFRTLQGAPVITFAGSVMRVNVTTPGFAPGYVARWTMTTFYYPES